MKLRITILAVLVAAAVAHAGQQPAPENPTIGAAQDQQTVFTSNSSEVNVRFSVTDKKGKLIPGLKKEDFRIFEDGIPQMVTGFNSEADPPLTISLLIDASGSIKDKLKFEQAAAADFFQYTLIRKKDKGSIISFDSGVDLLTPEFTDDPGALRDALMKVRAGGGTSMFDALYLAVKGDGRWLGLANERGRRVIVLISDGEDNNSEVSLTATLEAVQLNDVVVYAISTNSNFFLGAASPSAEGERNLRKLTDETGGQTFLPEREQDLYISFDRIKQDLRALYTINYVPKNEKRDGAFRKIRIDIGGKENKDYRARYRYGYYAPQPPIAAKTDTAAPAKK